MSEPIYLDYNATTPIDPRVADSMLPFIHKHFGNPSSSHVFGTTAKKAVENARKQVAVMLHCELDEIIFTSGGTESNNYAIKGAAYALRNKGNHIITSSIEHPAVIEVCKYLENQEFIITYLPVDEYGLVDPHQVEEAITPSTILISIMHANNEVGTIQSITEIADIAHRHGIIVHSDCAQSAGKIRVHVDELNIDLLSIAGHKIYAPKGVGALYIRHGVKLNKLIHGADHEMNFRAGTENVFEIVGLGTACEMITQNLDEYSNHMVKMRDRIENGLKQKFPGLRINGHPEKRLPNTSSISFKNIEANTLLSELTNVAASAGAACHSDSIDVSIVLEAMKVPLEYAMGTIRLSTGRATTALEIDRAIDEVGNVVEKLKTSSASFSVKTDDTKVKLTQYTHGLGCACKLRPQLLEQVLKKLPVSLDKNIIVGTDTSDDAAVYQIDDKTAIVQTVDFFTPIVDDPFQFGAIAAANSLSDIYAMGAKPLFALNIVGFPSNRLSMNVLEKILEGAQSKALEANISIIGGHTVDDTEPKYGLAVTGIADVNNIVTNKNAHSEDDLILTKSIGTGILSTALKEGMINEEQEKNLVEVMSGLNRDASEAMQSIGVNACTDITGFGLLGHMVEMMNASNMSAQIEINNIPLLPGVMELAVSGVIPGGTKDNYEFTMPSVEYDDTISQTKKLILNDAQTSGGLLISVPAEKSQKLLKLLHEKKMISTAKIGRVMKRDKSVIAVRD